MSPIVVALVIAGVGGLGFAIGFAIASWKDCAEEAERNRRK